MAEPRPKLVALDEPRELDAEERALLERLLEISPAAVTPDVGTLRLTDVRTRTDEG